jgi:hypothetical protein
VSGPLPDAVHDLTAARIWGIICELPARPVVPRITPILIGLSVGVTLMPRYLPWLP